MLCCNYVVIGARNNRAWSANTGQGLQRSATIERCIVSSTDCVCWCTAAWTEQHQDTCPTWQCLSAVTHVVSYTFSIDLWSNSTTNTSDVNWRPCVRRCRSTSVEQLSSPAQPPNRSLPSEKNLNRFFLDSHVGRDNVNFDCVKHSSNSLYRIIALGPTCLSW